MLATDDDLATWLSHIYDVISEPGVDDVAALHALVALHGQDSGECVTCAEFGSIPENHWVNVPWPCQTLRLLAWPYRTEPGWRDEWAPEGFR